MLVGREDELDRVLCVLREGGSVVVAGEAGAGKTALVAEAAVQLARPVRRAQCFRSLSWMAGAPLQQALGRALPAGDPAWTASWVVRSLAGAALVVDDLQWADGLTLSAVALVGRSAPVLATVRTADPGAADAMAAAATAGATRLDLALLDLESAVQLAVQLHPGLRPDQAEALARRCGGNPLLIAVLGSATEPSWSLRRSVTARLRRLGPDAWASFALLAVAGRPVPAAWLPERSLLLDHELASHTGEHLVPRHPLLAEVVLAELDEGDPTELAALHRRLAESAERAGDDALAARSRAAAGDRSRALELARRAAAVASQPGDRASLLHLAATCSDEDSQDLRRQAIEELVQAGDYDRAAELLALGIPEGTPDQQRARWCALQGRVHWQLGHDDEALADFEAGLELAEGGSATAILLQVEHARAVLLGKGDNVRGLQLAQAAHAEAVAHGVEVPRALAVLGSAEHFNGLAGDHVHLAEAVRLAAAEGDLMVELTSANNLIAALESSGEPTEAMALARRFATRAGELHLLGWQQQMQAMALNVQMHACDHLNVVAEAEPLLAGPLDRRTRDQLEVTLSLSLVDLGRYEEATRRLDEALSSSVEDHNGVGNLTWVLSEALLWGGDRPAAVEVAARALEQMPTDGRALFPLLTQAHAHVAQGLEPPAGPWPAAHARILDGAPLELAALQLQLGRPQEAAELFSHAAMAWTGWHRRGELRCRWLAAECAGAHEVAVAALLSLETELEALSMAPLLSRVRRSLRKRGVRRSAPRGQVGVLTAREREVLDLVAAGLATQAIGTRLGISPATVAALIASARSKLGAATRWQAASA